MKLEIKCPSSNPQDAEIFINGEKETGIVGLSVDMRADAETRVHLILIPEMINVELEKLDIDNVSYAKLKRIPQNE